jgi:hypothetical protein
MYGARRSIRLLDLIRSQITEERWVHIDARERSNVP